MKLEIDIKAKEFPQFIELMKANNFITDLKDVKTKRKSRFAKGLAKSFQEVKLYEEGKKDLKNAKDLINELRGKNH